MESDSSSSPTVSERAVLVEQIDRILVVTINRPQVRNAVDYAVTVGVGEALEVADRDREVWAVVITGSGETAFCAGVDLKALARGEPLGPDDERAAWGFAGYAAHHISKPTIAAVNGFALGGGTEIALASDLVVAAESARFGLPEVSRGVFAGAGGVFRLPAQIPRKLAMEMILTGDPVSARRALEFGLVNRVVPDGQALSAALALAARICANAPLSVQASKRIAAGIVDGRIEAESAQWALSTIEGARLMGSADSQEGPRAFTEHRPPKWQAR